MALCGISSSASAQVLYERELSGASSIGTYGPVLNISQAPGFYSATPTQTIITQGQIYEVDSATGVVSSHRDLPDGILLAPNSIASIVGQGSTQQLQYLFSAQGDVLAVDPQQNTIVNKPYPSVDIFARDWHSMAAQSRDSTELSFITTGFDGVTSLTLVNIVTGALTTTSVMSHLGTEAFYQSYGADGLLYVLDYGNDRMVSFDPANDFAQIGEFNFQTGVTLANSQFAIGANGNFYLGDGLGGGSTYAADGTYLNSFDLPDGVVGDPYDGASYLSTDSAGRIYVYDSATGFHQYQDVSVVPEPSTWALLLLGGAAVVCGYRRRHHRVAIDLRGTRQPEGLPRSQTPSGNAPVRATPSPRPHSFPRAKRPSNPRAPAIPEDEARLDRTELSDGVAPTIAFPDGVWERGGFGGLGIFLLRRRRSRPLVAIIALCGITSSASAQIVYVREIPVPVNASAILPIVQAPYVTGDPAVTNGLPSLITATSQYFTLIPTLGLYSIVSFYPPNVKLNANSRLSWLGQNSVGSGPTLFAVTPQHQLLTFDVRTDTLTRYPLVSVEYETASSIAARGLNDPISAILDSEHYTIDQLTGVATLQPLAGVDTATTQFMSYGADGLLYVLDYGNDRIASFNPDDAFAPVSSFTLQLGVTTANQQFAIGINGSFYLGDGLGGGSYYNSQGQFEGVFTLPGDATTSTYRGESYITTGADGSVYVYDKNYGFQQYQDMSVVPEPSTTALLILGGLGVFLLRRRWSRPLVACMALCSITSSAFAQIVYVRDIPVPYGATVILPIVQAPYVTGDPTITNGLPPLITSMSQYYTLNTTTGLYSVDNFYPPNVSFNANTRPIWLGETSADSGPMMLAINPRRALITYDASTDRATLSPKISLDYDSFPFVAARSLNDPISAILDSEHYTVDRLTGVSTLQPLDGVDFSMATYMSYGANGLLYVLDYGNSRIASFNPDDAFAPVSSFTLQLGVTTANEQFAIGINGNFYFGDGLGGGSYYNSQGEFEGVFTLPGDATTSTYRGESYITTGADGSVYVYDKNYGFQQYQDMSVVPEPSTGVLVITSLLGMLLFRRRWQRA